MYKDYSQVTPNYLQLVYKLQDDTKREYAHWHFYMNAAIHVGGLHREEYKEFFQEQAASEMKHIQEFGNLLVGLGFPAPSYAAPFFSDPETDPTVLLQEALKMEEEVVANFVERMDEADEVENNGGQDKVDARYIHLFLEDQMLDSRADVDNIKQILNR
jgi:ferritin